MEFIRVDKDGALDRSSELNVACHSMNIVVHITGGDASSINVKSEIINKNILNITKVFLLNYSHKSNCGVQPTTILSGFLEKMVTGYEDISNIFSSIIK